MNTREIVARLLLAATGRRVFRRLSEIHRLEELGPAQVKQHQTSMLLGLLRHAHDTVPHYQQLLRGHEIVENGVINLDRFSDLPPLTKNDIRESYKDLHSTKPGRQWYTNTSGGSTGEPVPFIQDRHYDDWNTANKLYFNAMHGKHFGEPEIKLWGSERDILEGSLGFRQEWMNYLYNRKFLNTFDLSDQTFQSFVDSINAQKPASIWGYYDSTYELAKYINENGLRVHSPKVVITTIGKLLDPMREEIKRAFRCPVVDQYGSREVGALAIEKHEQAPMAIFPWTHYVEVVDNDNRPTLGQEGRILVTTLQNYSMPLIRYEIGDLGVMSEEKERFPYTHLTEITGREFSHFVRRDGSLVHAQFFVILTFGKQWIRRFQFVQHDVDDIELIVDSEETPPSEHLAEMREKIQRVMGSDCKFRVRSAAISPTDSGKYLYTICEIR